MSKVSVALLLFGCLSMAACRPETPAGHPAGRLRLVQRLSDDACAYVSAAGDTVIPFGRYAMDGGHQTVR